MWSTLTHNIIVKHFYMISELGLFLVEGITKTIPHWEHTVPSGPFYSLHLFWRSFLLFQQLFRPPQAAVTSSATHCPGGPFLLVSLSRNMFFSFPATFSNRCRCCRISGKLFGQHHHHRTHPGPIYKDPAIASTNEASQVVSLLRQTVPATDASTVFSDPNLAIFPPSELFCVLV